MRQSWFDENNRMEMDRHYATLAEAIADRFRRDGFEVTVGQTPGGWDVRTRKSDNWRFAFGMVYDVHVRLQAAGDGFEAKVDLGDWADKVLSGALVLIGAVPWLVSGSVGLYNEYQQMKDVERIIDEHVAACGGAPAATPAAR